MNFMTAPLLLATGKKIMQTNRLMVMGLAVIFAMTLAGEAMARGGNGGGGGGNGGGASSQSSVNRPDGSQRRDGTFLTTGTTASGATARPDNGQGVRDGSRLNTPTTATAPVVTAPVVTE